MSDLWVFFATPPISIRPSTHDTSSCWRWRCHPVVPGLEDLLGRFLCAVITCVFALAYETLG
ncbi:hypothetical protein IHE45_06G025300 [Dioscorea alata]|uniref:Uncharacterized protein n=1 Tax=Dioscorea alata TaxID=55571 RepID=A0ACB7VVH0_DIOAL|nr:hypothetical protein IHE45_06G025300 [Dioscorea alata]